MPLPHMVSYAQNGEDVVLRRAFHGQEKGFWVDVGACDPELDSVTQHFSLLGWTGVNVEPDLTLYEKFVAARPHDINVRAAIAEDSQDRHFFPTGTRGHGTLVQEIAAERAPGKSYSVPSMPLAELIDKYVPDGLAIDFLKIDVEGFERAVIVSGDWERQRPRIVVVEAVDATGEPTHEDWESILLGFDYVFVLFDGLNRWYVRAEEPGLLGKLKAPANVIDNWTHASRFQLMAELERLQKENAELREKSANPLRRLFRRS
ncbi:FkbM family methyltransferase [Methylocystis sp. JAN1]|uniref:FkbM family methyltransferase n=1 Tax=Methylocystis sp. JAN1 TaxID=3397211 RepID=UPI003FA22311